jgi:hypothetical protein
MVAGTRSAPASINIAMDAAMHTPLPRWVKTGYRRHAKPPPVPRLPDYVGMSYLRAAVVDHLARHGRILGA